MNFQIVCRNCDNCQLHSHDDLASGYCYNCGENEYTAMQVLAILCGFDKFGH